MKHLEPPKSELWETTPHVITEKDWKIQSVWLEYRKGVLKAFFDPARNREPNILAKAKHVEKRYHLNSAQNSPANDLFGARDEVS